MASGGDLNQSPFLQVYTAGSPGGQPVIDSCNGGWITADADPTPPMWQYTGTFWLDAGGSNATFSHLCNVVALGQCVGHEDPADPRANDDHPIEIQCQLCAVPVPE